MFNFILLKNNSKINNYSHKYTERFANRNRKRQATNIPILCTLEGDFTTAMNKP